MVIEKIKTGYEPRPLQKLLHQSLKRFNVLVCHRRFGKTVFSINELIDKSLRNQRHNPQYAYIAPTYKQAKMIAWDYLQDFTRKIPGFEANKSELTVYIKRQGVKNGKTWIKEPDQIKLVLLGSDNPDALRGIYLDGCVIDEFAQCDPIVWGEIVRPALSDRLGWAIFIGTPKGRNHFYNILEKAEQNPRWFTAVYKASQTGVVPRHELEDMQLMLDDSTYKQELECDFMAALKGSYFGHLMNKALEDKRIGEFPYDPTYPVDTFWDLGISDSLTIWFRQRMKGTIRYIEYYEAAGKALPFIAKMLKEKEYVYGRHIAPWDAKTREMGTGLTRQETLRKLGIIVEIQKRQAVADRIQAARNLIPIATFDAIKCARGIKCLKDYQKEWDSKNMIFKDKPKHDWASDGADSFGYSALDSRVSKFPIEMDDLPSTAEDSYDELGGDYEL